MPYANTMTHKKFPDEPFLMADIGGTHARFAVAKDGCIMGDVQVLDCAQFSNIFEVTSAYISNIEPSQRPIHGIIAIAAPVKGDFITLTNLDWAFSSRQLCKDLNFQSLNVINDFTAIAWAVPRLVDRDLEAIGHGTVQNDAPIAILGPGSGLGISALVPTKYGWKVLPTESGHATLPAMTTEEDAVLDKLRIRFGHLSAERVLSGPGLINLHSALLEIEGRETQILCPKTISEKALNGTDETCRRALDLFYQFLGTVAGNVALNYDARGGVYLAGGILNKQGSDFLSSSFRERFEHKGRFSNYVAKIPTFSITHAHPAFVGMAHGPLD